MAVHESDREDLMKEATALRRRVELSLPGNEDTVIAGFRTDGRFSLFFGADPAYHFDADGRLRRSFYGGDLYRTQGDTLARLKRQRTPEQSQLLRHDLTCAELDEFLGAMDERLSNLRQHLQNGQGKTMRQIPEEPALIPEVLNVLALIRSSAERLAPAIKG